MTADLLWILPANVVGGAETWTRNLIAHLPGSGSTVLTHRAIAGLFADTPASILVFEDFGCTNPYDYTPRNLVRYALATRRAMGLCKPAVSLGLMHNGVVFLALASLLGRTRGMRVGSIMGHLGTFFGRQTGIVARVQRLVLVRCLARMDGLIAPSHGVAQDLRDHFGVDPDRLRVIHNGFPLDQLRERAHAVVPNLAKTRPWVTTACRLQRGAKDFATLFAAFRLIRGRVDAELILLGDGPDKAGLKEDCERLGISQHVRFLGHYANPMPYLAASDLFVLCSLAEGFGNVLVEAMAVGTPVVATDCPSGPREILGDGEHGILVPVRDPDALAAGCLELLQQPVLRRRYSNRAFARSASFDVRAKAGELAEYLENLQNRRN